MLQQTNVEIIDQLIDLLNSIESTVYTNALQPLHHGTVGQHVRHITEFYLCALMGCNNGVVDYDARERNLLIEIDKNYTIEILEKVKHQLKDSEFDCNLLLKSKLGNDKTLEISSSFFRELLYLIEHTVHHLAIIKIGLNEVYPEIKIPENFGVAHSTLRYRVTGY